MIKVQVNGGIVTSPFFTHAYQRIKGSPGRRPILNSPEALIIGLEKPLGS
jgi:hypothetical protein